MPVGFEATSFKIGRSAEIAARFILLAALMHALAGPVRAQSGDSVLRDFLAGTGANAVGVVEPREEAEIEVPQAIFSGDRGEVYLLDQANDRVLQFDPTDPSRPPIIMDLPDGLHPTDMVVSQDDFYFWDGEVRRLQAEGAPGAATRSLVLNRSATPPDPYAVAALAQMGSTAVDPTPPDPASRSVNVLSSPPPTQNVATRGGREGVAATVATLRDNLVEISVRRKGQSDVLARLRLEVRSRIGVSELLDVDRKGRFFVLAENIPADYTDVAAAFVARFAGNGTLEGIYELPLTGTVGLSRRFVTISPEGDVYFLRTRKANVDVLGVGFRPLKPGSRIDTAGNGQSLASLVRRKGAPAAVRPLTRKQVIETAFAFANARWRVTPAVYGTDPDSRCTGFNRVRRPGYLSRKLNEEVQGVPYCWGCMASLGTFANALDKGTLAGNICTRDDPRPDVSGVDCSSFVSAAWGLATHFTTMAIPAISSEVENPWDMLPGDAFNKPGSHVLLFVRFTPDRKAEVIEASPGACNGKVCRNIYPLSALLARGYKPVRYRGLVNDPGPASAVAGDPRRPKAN